MHQMRFDIRDIFKSPRLALSLQRIWIQFVGLFVGLLGYLILAYISLLTSGFQFSAAWKKYGLLPCVMPESTNWYSLIFFAIGAFWLIATYLITATAVSRATYMLTKGNNFYTWRESFNFAIKKAGAVLVSPLALIFMAALFLFGLAIIGWLGKIPYVGEFGLTLFTPFWFVSALIFVFLIIVFAVALVQVPAIIATTDDDAFEAVFQSFSLTWSQPWRLILYQVFSVALAIVGFLILAFLSKKAYLTMDRTFASTTGADFQNISAQAMYLLSVWLTHSITWFESLLGNYSGLFYFSREFDPLMIPGYQIAASYIFAIWNLLIGLFIVSYGVASYNVGNTLTYIILRKKKDDENLLERKDREEEDDDENEEETDKSQETTTEETTEAEK